MKVKSCEARVLVEFVETKPLEPTKRYPCDSEDRKRGPLMVLDAVEKKPLRKPKVVVVLAP